MNDVVKDIRNSFIGEAKNSPTLLSDLAHMEKYISESYDGRSLIELLQNADDVGATKFYLYKINDFSFLVANNGRTFTGDDLTALCRSGASTKKRKSNTIGFRGIGFKSVVNYSNIVHLISGEIKVTFSKELTQRTINSDINVPLIRIPHQFNENKYDNIIKKVINAGFNTIFIFEISKSTLMQEIDNFDNTCMLFLKHVEQIIIDYNNYKISAINRNIINNSFTLININTEKQDKNQWLIYNDGINNINSIAFKYENGKVIDSNNNENLIHSFMPTNDKFIIPCKVNGDFSTDPSRTKVIIDDETKVTIDEISNLIANLVIDIYKSGKDTYGIIKVLSKIRKDYFSLAIQNNINSLFYKTIEKYFLNKLFDITKNNKIAVQPSWLSDEDLNLIDFYEVFIIRRNIIENIDGLNVFLEQFGIKQLDINFLLKESVKLKFSLSTRINIIKNVILKYEFNTPNDIKNLLLNANLFENNNKIVKLGNVKNISDIDENLISQLNEMIGDNKKIDYFLQKFNIRLNSNLLVQTHSSNVNTNGNRNVIKKWRSVEENAKLLLEETKDVIKVIDVSMRNIGYDLEVSYNDGSKKYFEIKSVNSFGDLISITNNEYLTAIKNPNDYNLMIVQQTNTKIVAMIINDPIGTLDIEKRVKSFEWVCNSYNGIKIERNLDK